MSRYLAMLQEEMRKNENAAGGTLKNLKNPVEEGSLGFLGTTPPHFQKHEAIEAPANDPTPSPSRGEVQPRATLVSLEDLHQIQRHLLRHLTDCRDCCIDGHLYCCQAERTGNGYTAYLTEFPHPERIHGDFVAVVIQARIRGLQAGFRALDALTRPNPETWLETARSLIAGPAAVAFSSHVQVCAFCRPRSGEYCGEGRGLHQEARREGVQ